MSVQVPTLSVGRKSEALLNALSQQLGIPAEHLLAIAIDDLYQKYQKPITEIPGVDPKDTWDAVAEMAAGEKFTHEEVFSRLRNRP